MLKMSVPLAALLALASSVPAQKAPTADDFLAPINGGPTKVADAEKVKAAGRTIAAANAQDAINAAVDANKKELKDGGNGSPEIGARMVKFPSGLGFVATGAATYRVMENPVATRVAKRKAYVIAFAQAKKNLAEVLNGLSHEGKESIREALQNVNLPKEEMTNISATSEEAITQSVEMMLRGFVVYEVNDDTKQNTVTVSVVTTPKTRGKLARPAPNSVEANTLNEALNQIIEEVRSGVVPPVGGRIVSVRATGETAFVGFGSSVVRSSENSAVQAKLNLTAQKVAASHSKDALCGLISGDETTWKGGVRETLRDEVKEFEDAAKDDPLSKNNPAGVRRLEKARQTLVAKLQTDDTYANARKGIIPAGVITKTWFDEDHAWAYSLSVYVPSFSKAAEEAAREIKGSAIVPQAGEKLRGGGSEDNNGASGFTDERNPNVKSPGSKVKPGPGGKVGKDDDK
jgi:hypothetical protein